ncbi:GLCM Glucosylceramidase, partial [Nothoprocta ornata]|nr:GLCM Glucosylceramidase [Nothoprocta ornata]
EPPALPAPGAYVKYESSKAGKRLERSQGAFVRRLPRVPGLLLTLNTSERYQRVKGFGGSLSDAAAINILALSAPVRERLLRSYFSEEGIEYTLLRVPMGCSDFSERPYSYADVPHDYELRHFQLAEEDTRMKASGAQGARGGAASRGGFGARGADAERVPGCAPQIPILRRALAMSQRPLSLFASPWTAPAWLKSNGDVRGKGTLKGRAGDRHHRTWAKYFIRFLDEYAKRNVTFWAVTAQNEPRAALLAPAAFPTVAFSAAQQRDFIVRDLGPALARSPHAARILILDDQRSHLPAWAQVVTSGSLTGGGTRGGTGASSPVCTRQVLGNASAARHVLGIGVHWYLDALVPARCSLEATHRLFPRHALLYTEACSGFLTLRFAVVLGCWQRGDSYSHSILTVLNNYVTGWTDWNLALDLEGGPNWVKNYVDSPVIVDRRKDVFYKQPMFYHLGHFSKFIPEGSQRVGLASSRRCLLCNLEHVALLRPDGTAVLVVLNR